MTDEQMTQLAINTIRTLSIDAVQQAKSGHPGTPMALAPLIYTIWNRVMRFDPEDPIWPNRDRFVLSNGHASMLLWSVLHLSPARRRSTLITKDSGTRRYLLRIFVTFASSIAKRQGIRSTIGFRGSRRRLVRSGKASPRASAWPSPRSGSRSATTSRASTSSTTTSMPSAGTAA